MNTTAISTPRFRKMSDIDPTKDGVDFINIYSQGKTGIGKKLSHFAHTPFTHPFFGPFESMEGFWFYMKTGKQHDQLRSLYGNRAKQYGKQLKTIHYAEFKEDILAGNYQKIIQDEALCQAFINSDLPLTHYYLFKRGVSEQSAMDSKIPPLVIFPKNSDWLIDGLEDIRTALKQKRIPNCWTQASRRYVSDATDKAI
jgi:hypothetical protein